MKTTKQSTTVPRASSPRPTAKTPTRVSSPGPASRPQVKTAATTSLPSVRFEIYAPGAQQVSLAGSFNNWSPAEATLQPTPAGTWSREVKLTPGRYEYLFVVDGEWITDPKAPSDIPNLFGGRNSLLEVPAT